MKKIIALILSIIMICSMFAACSESKHQGGEVTTLPTTEAVDKETNPAETAPSDTETTPIETEPTVTDKDVSLGKMQGGVYTNEYVGFTCTLDENWTFATAEELNELPGDVSDLLSDSDFADYLGDQIFDMKAENETDLVSMNVLYQKLNANEILTYATMTEEQIIDTTLEQVKDSMIDAYKQAGIDATDIEKVTVTFCGKTRTAMLTTSTIQGIPYFILQILDYHLGDYSVTTTFASYVEDNTAKLLDMCSAIQ